MLCSRQWETCPKAEAGVLQRNLLWQRTSSQIATMSAARYPCKPWQIFHADSGRGGTSSNFRATDSNKCTRRHKSGGRMETKTSKLPCNDECKELSLEEAAITVTPRRRFAERMNESSASTATQSKRALCEGARSCISSKNSTEGRHRRTYQRVQVATLSSLQLNIPRHTAVH